MRRAARLHTGRLAGLGSAGHVAEHAVRSVPMSIIPIGCIVADPAVDSLKGVECYPDRVGGDAVRRVC